MEPSQGPLTSREPEARALVHRFYGAFSQGRGPDMASLYAPRATFSDPIFPRLTGLQAGQMWTMILSARQDFSMTYEIISYTKGQVTVQWMARYRFAKTKRMVVNHVRSELTIADGLIVEHRDEFSLYGWARQAFGATGLLLGWMPWFQRRLRLSAQVSLDTWASNPRSPSP